MKGGRPVFPLRYEQRQHPLHSGAPPYYLRVLIAWGLLTGIIVLWVLYNSCRTQLFSYVTNHPLPFVAPATIAMQGIDDTLNSILEGLSDQNYAESFDYYRIWFDIGHAYHGIPSNRIFDTIWKNRGMNSNIDFTRVQFIHSADLILRFACDAESDHILARHSSRLQSRLGTRALQEFFGNGMEVVRGYKSPDYVVVNLIAHWANLGYVEETAIRNHILQSLISHPTLHDSQAYSLIILFKLAGATFEAYVDPAVVDRCFKLLKGHSFTSPYPSYYDQYADDIRQRRELVEVSVPCVVKRGYRAKNEYLGGNHPTGAWMGGPPSPTYIHHREAKTGRCEAERPGCNSHCYIHWVTKQRSRTSVPSTRTSDPSIPSTRNSRHPGDRRDSCISSHSVSVHQYRHPLRLHDCGCFRRGVSDRLDDLRHL